MSINFVKIAEKRDFNFFIIGTYEGERRGDEMRDIHERRERKKGIGKVVRERVGRYIYSYVLTYI